MKIELFTTDGFTAPAIGVVCIDYEAHAFPSERTFRTLERCPATDEFPLCRSS